MQNRRFPPLLTFVLVLAAGLPVSGPWRAAASEADATTEVERYTAALRETGWKLILRQVGFLKPGKTVEYNVNVEKGKTYVFSVGGCHDAYDLDLGLLEGETVIARDDTPSRSARIDFVATADKSYKVLVKMSDCTPDGAHFCLLFGELLPKAEKK